MDVRRFSVNSVLDVSSLERYYNRMDVYASFTDDGEYDLTGTIDGNIRPDGIFAYPINDVVGRRSRETTLYARVFRFRNSNILETQNYRIDDYELDYKKLVKLYSRDEEALDEIYALVPGQLSIRTAFAHLWQLTFRLAVHRVNGMNEIRREWAGILQDLGYDGILDKRGTGVISRLRRPVLMSFRLDVEDLEVVSTQSYKQELNTGMIRRIARFNNTTKVANARRRIAKW